MLKNVKKSHKNINKQKFIKKREKKETNLEFDYDYDTGGYSKHHIDI